MIAKNRTCHHQVDLVLGSSPGDEAVGKVGSISYSTAPSDT